ncbi:hypothetical protein DL96DRAFT_1714896 [Flagelloscypha sp. PMI_526]|nr:hypothetical protein DL96DRAFT_1714896 [Flagelloscypha sp. PMI_526]
MIPDFYCMLSGVPAAGPPSIFPDEQELPYVVNHLVKLLVKMRHPSLPPSEELAAILTEALSLWDAISLLDDDSSRWCNPAVVFGPCEPNSPNPLYLRFCRNPSYDDTSFTDLRQSDGHWIEASTVLESHESVRPDCAFMDARCWYYIQSWFDVFPPGSNCKSGEATFAKALWEFVKERFKTDWTPECILPELDYGAMQLTFCSQRCFWVDYSMHIVDVEADMRTAVKAYCGSKAPRLAEAISRGLRGEDLFPAFRSDVRGWMFDEPDIWPSCEGETDRFKFRTYDVHSYSSLPPIAGLPLDLLLDIFPRLKVVDILHLSSVCKSVRNLLTHKNVFMPILHKMVLFGALRWVKPCAMVEGEVEDAREALFTWLQPQEAEECSHEDDPFLSPRFRWIPFIHACLHKSDSMRNRRRLWNMAKQLEGMWNPDFADWRFEHHRDNSNDEYYYSSDSLIGNSSDSEEG